MFTAASLGPGTKRRRKSAAAWYLKNQGSRREKDTRKRNSMK